MKFLTLARLAVPLPLVLIVSLPVSAAAQSPAQPAVAPVASPQTAASPGAVQTPAATTVATEPIHIGILAPHTSLTDPSVQAIGEQVRVLLAKLLTNPQMDTVLLFSATPDQVTAEAKQHHCAFVVDSTITQKKASGLNKMMLLQGASMMMPMASLAGSMAGSMGGMIAGTAAGAAMNTAGSIGGFMHSNTTWAFEYKLLPVGGAQPALALSETAKTKKDGDDVLTPMIQHAAEAISTQALKKQ